GVSGKIVLGFAGFVRDWHGLGAVIELLGQRETPPSLAMLVVGEGPALPALKARARALGIGDRVHFAGLIGRDAVARVIAAFDIALVPKCLEYASPLKLFEYMALKKAIVAPNQDNIREILSNGVSALLFDPERPESMTTAITQLSADPELRARL